MIKLLNRLVTTLIVLTDFKDKTYNSIVIGSTANIELVGDAQHDRKKV